jgi:hypothetical protein
MELGPCICGVAAGSHMGRGVRPVGREGAHGPTDGLGLGESAGTSWAVGNIKRCSPPLKAWKHLTGIRKSQGTPHGLTKEQAAAIVARIADLTR